MIYIYWRQYFLDLLPPGASAIVVLENTCNQTYTYLVDGTDATWLGRGDSHNSKYDYLEAGTSIDGILLRDDQADLNEGFQDDTSSDILYSDCHCESAYQ